MSVSTLTSADFHQVFSNAKSEIDELLQTGTPLSVAPKIASLRQQYSAVQGSLPGYDQRKYEGVSEHTPFPIHPDRAFLLGDLEGSLAALRAKEKPRTRFAFSKKTADKSTFALPLPLAQPDAQDGDTVVVTAGETPFSAKSEAGPCRLADHLHTISDLSNTRITLSSLPNLTGEYTLSLANLSSCIIDLRSSSRASVANMEGKPESIHVKGMSRCILLTDLLRGSALLHDLTDCLMVLGAHQFRMHTSKRSTVLLHVPSVPVIEHCQGLLFGSYPFDKLANSSTDVNRVDQLADFDWVRPGPSPNWRRLSLEQEQGVLSALDRVMDDGIDVDSTLSSALALPAALYTPDGVTTHA